MLHWGNKRRLFFKLVFQLINQQEKKLSGKKAILLVLNDSMQRSQSLPSEPSTLGKDSGDKKIRKTKKKTLVGGKHD